MKVTLFAIGVTVVAVAIFLAATGCCCNPTDLQVKQALKDADAKHLKEIQVMESNYKSQLKTLQSQLEMRDVQIFNLKAELNKWTSYYKWLADQTSTDRQKYLDALNAMLGEKKPTK